LVDKEEEVIDLTVWHPMFPQLEERARWTVLFLFLDEVLGEIGTQNWIGNIEMNDRQLANAIPLKELPAFVKQTQAQHEWTKGEPGQYWSVYQLPEGEETFPRSDVMFGSTCAMKLTQEYMEAKGELEDPLEQSGADYVYVTFHPSILPKGREVEERGKIEDALLEALQSADSGLHIGSAFGTENVYIDLLLFDGEESLAIVQEVLREMKLPKGTSIHFFAKEKRGRRVVL